MHTHTSRLKALSRLLLLAILAVIAVSPVHAQKVALKTNLLYDATLNPNIGIESAIAKKWTAELTGSVNGWAISDHRWKHWMIQPEVRYWFCDRFSGHFVGAHLLGGQYNVGGLDIPVNFLGTDFRKLKDTRFQGWFGGVGIAYGYAWALSKHWNIEAEIGLGWTYTRYDQFRCTGCGKKITTDHPHNYVGPTKLAVNLVYVF
ncbi:MAG: DUF3575 domain-containing protein [Bacteroides sp.]|nr:DUF3575 domain-containing protein [Bacteroides sp.]